MCDGSGEVDGVDERVRCHVCYGTTYAMKPDGKLGLAVLERRHPEYQRAPVQVQQSGSVDVNVNVRSVALTINVADLSPEQLRALAGGEADVIEAAADE